MRTSTVIGWAGSAAIAGGGLRVLGNVAFLSEPGFDPARFDLPAASITLGSLLLLVGLVGLHLREAPAYGRLGTAGFGLTFAGTLAGATLTLAQTSGLAFPSGAVIAATMAAGVVGGLGLLLLGVALLSDGTLPLPWGALPLAIFAGEVLSVVPSLFPPLPSVAEALVGPCWVLLGYALLRGLGYPGEDPGSRAAPQSTAPRTRRGGRSVFFRRAAATALGLVALLALGVLGVRSATNALGLGCNPTDREYFARFPQYAGREPELRSGEMGTCLAGFATGDPKGEVLDYYERRLREHGWEEVHRGKAAVDGFKGEDYYRVEYRDYRVPGGHPVIVYIHA